MAYLHDLADTWNDSGTTFTALKMNVTDTASNAASKLLDLQVGGSSKFRVDKNGSVLVSRTGANYPYYVVDTGSAYTGLVEGDLNTLKIVVNEAASSAGAAQFRFSSSTYGMWVRTGIALGSTASSPDVYLYRDAANTLALRNSTNAQVFNVYNTYTDASNYERGCIKWTTNVLEIGTEAAGTGTSRQLRLNAAATGIECRVGGTLIAEVRTTNLRPGLNSSYDLGSSGRSWRDVYLSPSSSITPASNGDLAIEATNNTTLTFKYKGSDGTVRSGTVALS